MSVAHIERSGDRERDDEAFIALSSSIKEKGDSIYITIANMANLSSLLMSYLDNINWVGFYLFDGQRLVLGPFQGESACTLIALSRGVCGVAARERRSVRVDNVSLFPGHIACSAISKSEIVIPILKNGELLGVLDIDAPLYSRFSDKDQAFLERLVAHFFA